MIEEYHKRLLHTGVNHTLSQIRTKYWIVRGRVEIKNILRKCRICRKYQGGPFTVPPISPWPKKQVNTISIFQAHWLRLLWAPVRKIAESREKKGMGLLIHLSCCEGHPPRNCRQPNSRGILVGITKIYCKTGKFQRNHLRKRSSIQAIKIHKYYRCLILHIKENCLLNYIN